MMEKRATTFSSKWGMVLACMGMAVGTGNIWRFPIQAAKNGGGSFLIPWALFLFIWSIPLLMIELAAGKSARRGPFGTFAKLTPPNFAWVGGFVSICTIMIMCYYAVVTGWTLKYALLAVFGSLNQIDEQQATLIFDQFRGSSGAMFAHLTAIFLALMCLIRGARSIELLNKILMPSLVVILLFGAINALLLPGSEAGLSFLTQVEPERLLHINHWIAGLTQSAWSTGAGWGLMLSYAVYASDKNNLSTPLYTGLGNNSVELIVGLMLFPAVFAILGPDAIAYVASASSKGGIAFQVVPLLFGKMSLGPLLNALFFFALASAAFTSLVAMLDLGTRFFIDFGFSRKAAMAVIGLLGAGLGVPSALNNGIFDNQDYIWGVGLILSGVFIVAMVIRFGIARFWKEIMAKSTEVPRLFQALIWFLFVEGLLLLGWWMYQLYQDGGDYLWTCALQWGLVLFGLWLFRKPLHARMNKVDPQS